MASDIQVRRAKLADSEEIATFINRAPNASDVTRSDIAERFGQVGFLLAERGDQLVGLLGWQIENLVVRMTDFLVVERPAEPLSVGEPLIAMMEEEARSLQAEVIILFLPRHPSPDLIAYWEEIGYERQPISKLPGAWCEAVEEWSEDLKWAMIKRLRDDLTHRPM